MYHHHHNLREKFIGYLEVMTSKENPNAQSVREETTKYKTKKWNIHISLDTTTLMEMLSWALHDTNG